MRVHGGRIRAALDFSVNINPLGPPQELLEILGGVCNPRALIERYPDYEYRALREALSEFYSIDQSLIVPLNGSSEALPLLVLALRPRRIVSLEPTFGDHRILCETLGIDCSPMFQRDLGDRFSVELGDLEKACRDEDTLIYMSNPNNPTGSYIDSREVIDLASRCRARILVDEAYAELCDRCDRKLGEPYEGLIVARSLTKWLSAPGLRIGFLASSRAIARAIDSIRPPWNVNSIAECSITALLKGYGDRMEGFIERSRAYIAGERRFLSEALSRAGLQVYESSANYLLARIPGYVDTDIVLERLQSRGVSVRDCRSFAGLGKGFIRISIRERSDNSMLAEILSGVLRSPDPGSVINNSR